MSIYQETSSQLLHVTTLLCALVVATGLFFLSRAPDRVVHQSRLTALEGLQRWDAVLNQHVLRARDGLVFDYDVFVVATRELRRHFHRLISGPSALPVREENSFLHPLHEYYQLLERKEQLVEQFKSRNAILQHSRRYFVSIAAPTYDAATLRQLKPALWQVLRYLEVPSEPHRQQVLASRDALTELGNVNKDVVDTVRRQMTLTLDYQPAVNQAVQQMFALPISRMQYQLAELYRMYDAAFRARAEGYRVAFYIFLVGLLGYVTWLLNRLRTVNTALIETHSSIETRVAQRTQTLEQANRSLSAAVQERLSMERVLRLKHQELSRQVSTLSGREQRFRSLCEYAPVAVIGLDADGSCLYCNPHFSTLTGLSSTQVNAGGWLMMIHPDDRGGLMERWEHAMNTGEPLSGVYRIRRWDDGNPLWCQIYIVHDAGTQDGRGGYVGVIVDRTELVVVEDRVQVLCEQVQQILAAATEGIYGCDTDGTVIFMNRAGAQCLGFEVEELVGASVHDTIFKPPQHACVNVIRSPWKIPGRDTRESVIQQDDVYWRRDGTRLDVQCTRIPLHHGETVVGVVVAFQEVSERECVDTYAASTELSESVWP